MTMIRSSTGPLTVAALIVLATTPSVAVAQSTVEPTLERWHGLKMGELQSVYVLDDTGVETSGRLVGLTPESLVLLVGHSERRFAFEEVVRIQKRDSLKNGTIIGAAVGAAMGLVAAGISDCPGDQPGGSCPWFRAGALIMSTGLYAGLGAGIDALIPGRTTLYVAVPQSPTHTSSARGAFRPVLRFGFSW
jgi:hypothetical protein